MTAGGRELGARRSPSCSFYLAANFPDLTSKARNRSLRPEGVSLFERHPPHFSTGVYIACYCAQLGEIEEAQEWFKAAMALDENTVKRMGIDDPDLEPLWQGMRDTTWKKAG